MTRGPKLSDARSLFAVSLDAPAEAATIPLSKLRGQPLWNVGRGVPFVALHRHMGLIIATGQTAEEAQLNGRAWCAENGHRCGFLTWGEDPFNVYGVEEFLPPSGLLLSLYFCGLVLLGVLAAVCLFLSL